MRINHIVTATLTHLMGHVARRALLAIIVAAFTITAIYHVSVAGTMALEVQYGALYAQLIVAGIYAALALLACAIWWVMRAKAASAGMPVLTAPRKMQLVMLLEAAMLGYALARKGNRAS